MPVQFYALDTYPIISKQKYLIFKNKMSLYVTVASNGGSNFPEKHDKPVTG